jgi:hypothetical protein
VQRTVKFQVPLGAFDGTVHRNVTLPFAVARTVGKLMLFFFVATFNLQVAFAWVVTRTVRVAFATVAVTRRAGFDVRFAWVASAVDGGMKATRATLAPARRTRPGRGRRA